MVTVYGEDCVSDKSVIKGSAHFLADLESLVGDSRPGQANTVITVDLIDKADEIVRSDRRVTLRMLAVKVDVSFGTVWTIVHERLRYRKVCELYLKEEDIIRNMEHFHEESGCILKAPLKYPRLKLDAIPVYVQDYFSLLYPKQEKLLKIKKNEIKSYSC
ncbi:hypothetical protein HNY73_001666 [Argiope bruennichi]|uniref:Uncharacterized protein n=1 Tax=Argiope bruennichi TaxID=94029 RepID=A0A8T0FR85_ARGBR|nr:hypothetical protein HNY73_001666 [Argiope bruennichi]